VLRAVLGRPALSGAAALAVVSAASAAIASATGHAPAIVADGPTTEIIPIASFDDAGYAAQQPTDVNRRISPGRYRVMADDAVKQRKVEAARTARSAHRKALTSKNPKVVAQAMLSRYGWGASQFGCLDRLWTKESMWSLTATNPSSGAYGIPQALPGSKMASAGPDWRTNPVTQISWGLGYIRARYGSPCGAWGHSMASGWY
jgi:hypothetical protein